MTPQATYWGIVFILMIVYRVTHVYTMIMRPLLCVMSLDDMHLH